MDMDLQDPCGPDFLRFFPVTFPHKFYNNFVSFTDRDRLFELSVENVFCFCRLFKFSADELCHGSFTHLSSLAHTLPFKFSSFLLFVEFPIELLGKVPKKSNLWTHPRVFVRFGNTKGEIWVKRGNFRDDLGGFESGLEISHPTQPYLGKISKKIRFYFWGLRSFVMFYSCV